MRFRLEFEFPCVTDSLSRRRLVQVGGAGTVASLAGCLDSFTNGDDDGDDGVDPSDDDGASTPSVDGEAVVAVGLSIDDEELMALQQELAQQVQEGEMTEEEFQQEMQEAQDEIVGEEIENFEAEVEEIGSLDVGQASTQTGLVLLGGDPEDLIDVLELESVGGLFAESDFPAE